LYDLANPGSIQQGNQNTCAVNGAEVQMISSSPSTFTQTVADTTEFGGFAPAQPGALVNDYVQVPSQDLTPQPGSLIPGSQTPGNQTDYASQLFQAGFINAVSQKGGLDYISDGSGTAYFQPQAGKDGDSFSFSGLPDNLTTGVYQGLTGQPMTILENSNSNPPVDGVPGVMAFNSADGMMQSIQTLVPNGAVSVAVNGETLLGNPDGDVDHIVTVTNVNPDGTLTVNTGWGTQTLTADQLFEASQTGLQTQLGRQVNQDIANTGAQIAQDLADTINKIPIPDVSIPDDTNNATPDTSPTIPESQPAVDQAAPPASQPVGQDATFSLDSSLGSDFGDFGGGGDFVGGGGGSADALMQDD
jgi:hypothetical protein